MEFEPVKCYNFDGFLVWDMLQIELLQDHYRWHTERELKKGDLASAFDFEERVKKFEQLKQTGLNDNMLASINNFKHSRSVYHEHFHADWLIEVKEGTFFFPLGDKKVNRETFYKPVKYLGTLKKKMPVFPKIKRVTKMDFLYGNEDNYITFDFETPEEKDWALSVDINPGKYIEVKAVMKKRRTSQQVHLCQLFSFQKYVVEQIRTKKLDFVLAGGYDRLSNDFFTLPIVGDYKVIHCL